MCAEASLCAQLPGTPSACNRDRRAGGDAGRSGLTGPRCAARTPPPPGREGDRMRRGARHGRRHRRSEKAAHSPTGPHGMARSGGSAARRAAARHPRQVWCSNACRPLRRLGSSTLSTGRALARPLRLMAVPLGADDPFMKELKCEAGSKRSSGRTGSSGPTG